MWAKIHLRLISTTRFIPFSVSTDILSSCRSLVAMDTRSTLLEWGITERGTQKSYLMCTASPKNWTVHTHVSMSHSHDISLHQNEQGSFILVKWIVIFITCVCRFMHLGKMVLWAESVLSSRMRHERIHIWRCSCLVSSSSRWGVSLLCPWQAVSGFSLGPLCVARGATCHSGAALSGLASRPGQLRPWLAVWRQRALPGDVAAPRLRRLPARSPNHHPQQHRWQRHSAIWCLLLQRSFFTQTAGNS